jgi:pyrrolysine biosynthesis protein PylC
MKLAIVGGELRAVEAAYLAKKAGFETYVISQYSDAPAFSLSNEHAVLTPAQESDAMRIFRDCDAVLPTCDNIGVLSRLDTLLERAGIPFLFDLIPYLITSSKSASNGLMEKMRMPMPRRWQECGYPVIVKPSSHSRGMGVTVAYSEKEVGEGIERIMGMGDEPVIQEFVTGRNVSMQVIGDGHEFMPFALTEAVSGKDHDCSMVRCMPNILSEEKEDEFRRLTERLAESVNLRSVMDVEAIDTENGLKIIEMDARIPCQTPAAVLAATDINLLEELADLDLGKKRKIRPRASSYEYFLIDNGKLMPCGETEFAKIRDPAVMCGLFGSDEMITDYTYGSRTWRCAVINSADTEDGLEKKRARCIESIMSGCELSEFTDISYETAAGK